MRCSAVSAGARSRGGDSTGGGGGASAAAGGSAEGGGASSCQLLWQRAQRTMRPFVPSARASTR
jgi:hypothetical protein